MCRRKQWMTAVLLATLTAVLTACGSAKSSADTASVATYDTEAAMVEDTDYFSDGTYEEVTYDEGESGTEVTEEVAATERKLIKNVSLDVETENYDSLIQTVESQVQQLGGYIESRYSNNRQYGNPDYYADNRYTSMTIRIPKEKLDTFLQTMGEESNIVSQSESVTDVTLQYVDLESHKKALVTEQDRLLELLEQAETVEDIMTIESRLSDVRYQIESMESQLRTYDNQVDYSTVNLSIDEVEQYTPSPDISAGEKMKQGFVDSLKAVGNGFYQFFIWFVIHIPYLVVWGIMIAVIALIIRILIKRNNARVQTKKIFQQSPGYQVNPNGMTNMQMPQNQSAGNVPQTKEENVQEKKEENSNGK